MNTAVDQTTAALTELAQGKLSPAARRDLALRALHDAQLAQHLKLALRLAEGSAEVTRDWVSVAAAAPSPARSEWWRPLAGVTASIAIIAAVMSMPRMPQDDPADMAVAHMQQSLPDRIGDASFEAPTDLFGGSFEAD